MGVVDGPCLFLNRNWQPITFKPVRTAFEDVLRDMASFLDPDTYMLLNYEEWIAEDRNVSHYVQTASGLIPAPEIVVLKRYGERPPQRIGFNRSNLWRRDQFECQYCGDMFTGDKLSIDHVLPSSRGGSTTWDNCVAACKPCNGRKADKTPAEARMRLKKKPTAPSWKPGLRLPQGVVKASWEPFLAKVG